MVARCTAAVHDGEYCSYEAYRPPWCRAAHPCARDRTARPEIIQGATVSYGLGIAGGILAAARWAISVKEKQEIVIVREKFARVVTST